MNAFSGLSKINAAVLNTGIYNMYNIYDTYIRNIYVEIYN